MNNLSLLNAINILRPQNDRYITFIAEFNNIKYIYYKTHLLTENFLIEQWDCNIIYSYDDFAQLKNTEKGDRHYFYIKDNQKETQEIEDKDIYLLLRHNDEEYDKGSIIELDYFENRFKFLKNYLYNINIDDLTISDSDISKIIQYSNIYMFNIKNVLKNNNNKSDFLIDSDFENDDEYSDNNKNDNKKDDIIFDKENEDPDAKYFDEDFMLKLQ